MTPVWVDPSIVVPFVAYLAKLRPDFGNCRTMAVMNSQGQMVAGIVFHNWNPEAGVMEVSAASVDRRWASRGVLCAAFGYIFETCQLAIVRTAVDNVAVRRLWKAFGSEEHILPHLRGRGASEAVLLLTSDAWASSNFMRKPDGKSIHAHAA